MNLHMSASIVKIPLGVGYYGPVEAGRLLATPARNIRRWMGGYSYRERGEIKRMPALWSPQLPNLDNALEIGFRDLIELKFVKAFLDAGLGLKTIRYCLATARTLLNDERPLSTRRFLTDGRSIFLEAIEGAGPDALVDLKTLQYQLRPIIERTFKDLDIDDEIVARWRPFDGKPSIVIDPARAFGRPVATESGVPTEVLADAVLAEGSIDSVARIFDVSAASIRDAVSFEARLNAA